MAASPSRIGSKRLLRASKRRRSRSNLVEVLAIWTHLGVPRRTADAGVPPQQLSSRRPGAGTASSRNFRLRTRAERRSRPRNRSSVIRQVPCRQSSREATTSSAAPARATWLGEPEAPAPLPSPGRTSSQGGEGAHKGGADGGNQEAASFAAAPDGRQGTDSNVKRTVAASERQIYDGAQDRENRSSTRVRRCASELRHGERRNRIRQAAGAGEARPSLSG